MRGGRDRRMPSRGVAVMVQVVRSWLRSAWAPSRAVLVRAAFREVLLGRVSGFGSRARRWPRSNV